MPKPGPTPDRSWPSADHRALLARLPTIETVIAEANRALPPALWRLLSGGAGSESTVRRNRSAMDRVAFRPRVLRGVRERSTSSTLLGRELRSPVVLAPAGSVSRCLPAGAIAPARVAERTGALAFISSAADPPLEAVCEAVDLPVVWQLYVRGDRRWIEGQLRRAEAVGCAGICLTVDLTAPGRWEHDPWRDLDGTSSSADRALFDHQSALTWEDVDWMRQRTDLRLILKGIMCGDDASLAVEHGVDVVYVSNHGGRLADNLCGTLEILPEVIAAVDGRAEVIVDGGFVHGSDVVKALALGAHAVAVGKLMLWALAVAGESGLEHVLMLLAEEILDVMARLGVRSVEELGPEHVTPVVPDPVGEWIGLAGSRCPGA